MSLSTYDEPLLHTMYVDKALSGVNAVQTLSRMNRAHPQKHDCFVLDFQNNSETITLAFQDCYRTTLLAETTDPNKLHDLQRALDGAQVVSPDLVQQFTVLFLASVMPGTNAKWEKLSILLNLLVPKLPAPKEEDLALGLLEAIDSDSYRVEKKA